MGSNNQLSQAQDEDVYSPVKMEGKQLKNRFVVLFTGKRINPESAKLLIKIFTHSVKS